MTLLTVNINIIRMTRKLVKRKIRWLLIIIVN